MSNKKEVAVIDFTKFDIQQLPELHGKKEEIKKVIKANPVVKITDNASYELAKKSRTAVKTLRTSLEKEKKEVNDRIKKSVLEVVANEYDSLITSVRNDENARQEEVTAWEEIKENERLEKLRLEQERVDNIKKSINDFYSEWSQRISQLDFANIEEFEDKFTKAVANYDTSSLAEFEVLFSDSWSQLTYALSEKKSTLTEQENIRITKIELEKEQERQRLEAERIANEQRIEREKLEAEQKRIAEEQRIAQENFLREKREFEEKKNKQIQDTRLIKWTERFSNPEIRNEIMLSFSKDIEFYVSSNSSDEEFLSWVTEFGNRYDALINQEELAKSNESANFNYNEEDVDPKGVEHRKRAIVEDVLEPQEVEFEETWESIQNEFYRDLSITTDSESALWQYLEANFNVPSRKN